MSCSEIRIPVEAWRRRSRQYQAIAPCAVLLLCCFALLLPACNREPLSGPPELRLGRDECGECGMLINEDRCSTAFLVERDGRREYVMFDDLGCMLDYEHDGKAGTIVDGFVRDYDTRAWLRSDDAVYLFTDPKTLPTPMGSGMIALAQRETAEEKQAHVDGEILDYQELAKARREWMYERYGRPDSTR
jgi:copper chaperone NosL